MKTYLLLIALFLIATLQSADLPTGQKTPEGVACDAVTGYINRDAKAWLVVDGGFELGCVNELYQSSQIIH